MEAVKTLIDKAANKVGTRYKLAQMLNVPASTIYNWETGRKPCPAEDRARLAGVAGEDALQELVRATIENAKGEVKRSQLEKLLGKASQATGAALHSVGLGLVSLTFLTDQANGYLIRCIERLSFRPHQTTRRSGFFYAPGSAERK